jgi:hypothetical protein
VAQKTCVNLLSLLRDKGRFLLQQTTIDGQLPHNAEIKIQNGGIHGLLSVVSTQESFENHPAQASSANTPDTFHTVNLNSSHTHPSEQDIAALIATAVQQYESLEQLPYSDIMQVMSAFKTRRKTRRKS